MEAIKTELIYIWYYFDIQFRQIFTYWAVGILTGSVISVFFKDKINSAFSFLSRKRLGVAGVIPASILGIVSPLCMYGTIPLAASFSKSGISDELIGAFAVSSALLNPQLIIYSAALGAKALAVRIISCFICGCTAGLLIHIFFKKKPFFDFSPFEEKKSRDTDPNIFIRLIKNIGRNIKATAPMFLVGILLSAVFQRYVPSETFASVFGKNQHFGVLMAATVGVPLYACGGGTVPLLQQWIGNGMSLGSAAAFMITGPSTKITNLGALKIVMGLKHFLMYLAFIIIFSLVTGITVNVVC